jgi:anaerobic selenocysteine-containing dehydrogenase
VVTGNLDREGGAMFGASPAPFEDLAERLGFGTYATHRSRIGGFPEVLANLPAALMAKEITTPGEGQIRALLVSAGNPLLSVPNGEELEAALQELGLLVSIDIYVNETNRHADYVLPATTFLEREDFPLPFMSLFTTPFIQMAEPVVEPYGEARQEWQVIDDIGRRIGVVPATSGPARLIGKLGLRMSPRRMFELVLRLGPQGDLFGLRRGGLNLDRLRRNPRGIVLSEHLKAGTLASKIRHRDRRVRLDPREIREEAGSLSSGNGHDPAFPLRLIGLRELRSHNSWMHNASSLMTGDRGHAARIHPQDAAVAGVEDGLACRIVSRHGSIEIDVRITEEVKPGTVAVPHGWGHRGGGWRTANRAGGANVNLLASSDPADLERLAGMAFLNGIPVRIEAGRVAAASSSS